MAMKTTIKIDEGYTVRLSPKATRHRTLLPVDAIDAILVRQAAALG